MQIDERFLSDFESKIVANIAQVHGNEAAQELFTSVPFTMEEWLDRPFLQTRTFENKGLIYIGMELPDAFNKYLEKINQSQISLTKENLNNVVKTIQTTWFELVGEHYSLETSLKMDRNFVATFPVDQNRLSKEHSYCEILAEGSRLLVTAAGDAFASPHFMRYSGLTGARENILHLQEYMKDHIQQNQPEEELLKILAQNGDRTARFVIDRGNAFLSRLTTSSVIKSHTSSMMKSLEMAAKNWNEAGSTLEKISEDVFLLKRNGIDYILEVLEDQLTVNGGIYKDAAFNSIKHLLLVL